MPRTWLIWSTGVSRSASSEPCCYITVLSILHRTEHAARAASEDFITLRNSVCARVHCLPSPAANSFYFIHLENLRAEVLTPSVYRGHIGHPCSPDELES